MFEINCFVFLVVGICIVAGAAAAGEEIPQGNITTIVFDNDGLTNCVSVNPTAILLNGSLDPSSITIPGQALVSADIVFTRPLPPDLQLRLELEKIEPFPLKVPCLSIPPWEIGSCTYDLCGVISIPAMCNALLPPELGCECPLRKGTFTLPKIPINIPTIQPIIAKLMVGNYLGKAIMYSKATPDWTIGCLQFRFSLLY